MFHEKKSGTKSEKLRSFEKEEACRASMYQAKKKKTDASMISVSNQTTYEQIY